LNKKLAGFRRQYVPIHMSACNRLVRVAVQPNHLVSPQPHELALNISFVQLWVPIFVQQAASAGKDDAIAPDNKRATLSDKAGIESSPLTRRRPISSPLGARSSSL
jgi:hypothetical protein